MIQFRIIITLFLLSSIVFGQDTIRVGKSTASPPVDVLVPVSVSSSIPNVKSISLQFSYDEEAVVFSHDPEEIKSGVTNFSLPDDDNLFVSCSGGLISLSWVTPSGATLDGKLFDLQFLYVKDFSEVRFVAASIKNMQGKKITLSMEHGSISENTDPAVKLTYPNGGELIEIVGPKTNITWTSIYMSNIDLEISDDNGANWKEIVSDYPAINDSYLWTVPDSINSTECKIRITDSDSASTASDESDNVFTINSTATIELLTPNGGEELQVAGAKLIQWKSKNIEKIKIEFCTNSKSAVPTWLTILDSISAPDSCYRWLIPDNVSADCKIRVSDLANLATVFDTSDAAFIIHNHPVNVTVNDTVDAHLDIIGKIFGFFYWWDDSTRFWHFELPFTEVNDELIWAHDTLIVNGTVTINVGWLTSIKYFEMTLTYNPDVLTPVALIPVYEEMRRLDYSYEDGVIHIIWSTGEPIDIHGKIFDLRFRYKNFEDPEEWVDADDVDEFTDGNPSLPDFQVDPRNFSDLKIEQMVVKDAFNHLPDVSDWNNGSLAISDLPALKLLAPKGRDTLEFNDVTSSILWQSRRVGNVSLSYSTNNGGDWTSIVNPTSVSSGSWIWNLPDVNSNDCKLRINVPDSSSVGDTTKTFTITNAKSVDLTSPDGDEILKTGTKKNITWRSRNIEKIKLEYSITDTTGWVLIADSINAKDYQYEWLIPAENSATCRVRIRNVADSTYQDSSLAVFTINSSKTKISISCVVIPSGSDVEIPVSSDKVNGATYFLLSIKYDTSVMELDTILRSSAIGDGLFNYVVDSGVLRIMWFNFSPVDFSGNLFTMYFKNYNGSVSAVQFDDPNEVKDAFEELMDIEFVNGGVGVTDVEQENIPVKYDLSQNYPNPFNPVTTIRYEIPKESRVEITIFNILGQRITTLVDEIQRPGFYDAKWNANNCSSGIYFYSIVTDEFCKTKKMILLK
jgi:hypothetical protein